MQGRGAGKKAGFSTDAGKETGFSTDAGKEAEGIGLGFGLSFKG